MANERQTKQSEGRLTSDGEDDREKGPLRKKLIESSPDELPMQTTCPTCRAPQAMLGLSAKNWASVRLLAVHMVKHVSPERTL